MRTTKTTPKPSESLKSAVRAYLAARAMAETLRPVIRKIEAELLAEMQPQVAAQWAEGRGGVSGTITNPDSAYLMSDEDAARFYPELSRRKLAIFPGTPEDHCPYLMARHAQTQAEWALIDAAIELHGNAQMNSDNLYGETRAELIDLTVRFVVPHL